MGVQIMLNLENNLKFKPFCDENCKRRKEKEFLGEKYGVKDV